jgi:hypothetical protein
LSSLLPLPGVSQFVDAVAWSIATKEKTTPLRKQINGRWTGETLSDIQNNHLPAIAMDRWVQKLPGSMGTKVGVAAVLVIGALGYPIFYGASSKSLAAGSKQGHDYLSSEKPEAIRAGQEQARKLYRQQRELKQQQKEEQSSPK